MKKIISSLALTAALGAGMVGGAQAQTFAPGANPPGAGSGVVGTPAGIYSLSVTTNVTQITPTDYRYAYVASLHDNSSNTNVTQFSINNIEDYISQSALVTDFTRDPGTLPANGAPGTDFSSSVTQVQTTLPDASGNTLTSLAFAAKTSGFQIAGPASATAPIGLPGDGDTVTFTYDSTLPPASTVSLGSNGRGGTGNLAGTGFAAGPGVATPVVPEAGSFALLGLGLLPLGLLTRRRLARNN